MWLSEKISKCWRNNLFFSGGNNLGEVRFWFMLRIKKTLVWMISHVTAIFSSPGGCRWMGPKSVSQWSVAMATTCSPHFGCRLVSYQPALLLSPCPLSPAVCVNVCVSLWLGASSRSLCSERAPPQLQSACFTGNTCFYFIGTVCPCVCPLLLLIMDVDAYCRCDATFLYIKAAICACGWFSSPRQWKADITLSEKCWGKHTRLVVITVSWLCGWDKVIVYRDVSVSVYFCGFVWKTKRLRCPIDPQCP